MSRVISAVLFQIGLLKLHSLHPCQRRKTDVSHNAVFFQRNVSEDSMHLIIITLLMVIMKTKVVAVLFFVFFILR